ncbi:MULTISPECIES: hypothetical protein [Helicobacter]|uniref:hypothetical protein n=1 Tax=Helicobacter TaxID=209 RepID=UPI000ADB93BC|nr:hypothetical protein [Helicobacter sp. MIT 03-1616]TLD89398.1 hypothetical protein LS67_002905 [Helicobacter sp. MIT 03-1616]
MREVKITNIFCVADTTQTRHCFDKCPAFLKAGEKLQNKKLLGQSRVIINTKFFFGVLSPFLKKRSFYQIWQRAGLTK